MDTKRCNDFKINDGISKKEKLDYITINSIYDYEKITSLFKNFDTLSFLDLIMNYNKFLQDGYNNIFLDQSLHAMLSLLFLIYYDSFSRHYGFWYFKNQIM